MAFVRFPWANNATAMPRRQNTEAVKMRRLKKADCEVDFFFIDDASFSLRSRVGMLSVMPEACQHFFKFFTKFIRNRSLPDSDLRVSQRPNGEKPQEWIRHVKSLGLAMR